MVRIRSEPVDVCLFADCWLNQVGHKEYTIYALFMPNYASFTFGLRCVYGARRLPVSPLSYGLRAGVATAVRLSYGFTGP